MTTKTTKLTILDLMNAAKELDNSLPFMEGRQKGEMKRLVDSTVTIIEYGFLTDEKKGNDYAVFIVAEDPQNFYFGGQVLTDGLQTFEGKGLHEVITEEGLPVELGEKLGGNGRNYVTAKFFPDAE